MIVLRDYQIAAIASVREAMRSHRRVLMVAPTGFGKTATASELMRRSVERGKRVLFLVHRREIVQDTARRLRDAGVPCGITMAGVVSAGDAPVTVASTATITAREHHPPADLVIWDEAHHAAARTYREIAAQYPRAHHLGLTATPERGDGVGLRDAFDAIVVGSTIPELQSAGWLAECDVIAPGERLRGLASDPAEAWRMFSRGLPTVAFCASVEASIALAEAIGDRAAHVDGTTSIADRERALRAFSRGEIDLLSNVYVLTEGWDEPRAKCCLLARGVGHAGAYLQMVGRVLRRQDDTRALVIDLGGVIHDHGMPDEPRTYSLDGIARAPAEARVWLSQCLACGTTVAGLTRGEACEACGTVWPEREPPKIVKRELGVVTRASMDAKRDEYARLAAIATERGYKPGWVAHRYHKKFGVWPKGVRQ